MSVHYVLAILTNVRCYLIVILKDTSSLTKDLKRWQLIPQTLRENELKVNSRWKHERENEAYRCWWAEVNPPWGWTRLSYTTHKKQLNTNMYTDAHK